MAHHLRSWFTQADLNAVREGGIKAFIEAPGRARLPDMHRDLTEDEQRTVAFFISSLQHLIRMGFIEAGTAEALFPEVYTKYQQLDDEQLYSASADASGAIRKKKR